MDLKDYRVQPDEGLFEKISQRVRRRRLMRRAGVAAGIAVVAVVVAVVLWPLDDKSDSVASPQVSRNHEILKPRNPESVNPSSNNVQPITADATVAAPPKQQSRADSILAIPFKAEQPAERVEENQPLVQQYTAPIAAVETKPVLEPRRQTEDEPQNPQPQKAVEPTEVTAPSVDTPVKSETPEEPVPHEDNLFWAPNIIVPAGDVDNNRTFSIKFTSAVSHFQIYIYNRGGRQLFHSNDPAFVWDGTFKGSALPQGAYIWLMRFRDSSGKLHEENGTVTLVR